jgi:hypothetical protein
LHANNGGIVPVNINGLGDFAGEFGYCSPGAAPKMRLDLPEWREKKTRYGNFRAGERFAENRLD